MQQGSSPSSGDDARVVAVPVTMASGHMGLLVGCGTCMGPSPSSGKGITPILLGSPCRDAFHPPPLVAQVAGTMGTLRETEWHGQAGRTWLQITLFMPPSLSIQSRKPQPSQFSAPCLVSPRWLGEVVLDRGSWNTWGLTCAVGPFAHEERWL